MDIWTKPAVRRSPGNHFSIEKSCLERTPLGRRSAKAPIHEGMVPLGDCNDTQDARRRPVVAQSSAQGRAGKIDVAACRRGFGLGSGWRRYHERVRAAADGLGNGAR